MVQTILETYGYSPKGSGANEKGQGFSEFFYKYVLPAVTFGGVGYELREFSPVLASMSYLLALFILFRGFLAVRLARHQAGDADESGALPPGAASFDDERFNAGAVFWDATALLTGMDVSTVVGLRDRAIIAVMTYTFARVGAVVALAVEDFFSQKKRWWLRLHEKTVS